MGNQVARQRSRGIDRFLRKERRKSVDQQSQVKVLLLGMSVLIRGDGGGKLTRPENENSHVLSKTYNMSSRR